MGYFILFLFNFLLKLEVPWREQTGVLWNIFAMNYDGMFTELFSMRIEVILLSYLVFITVAF